VCLLPAGVTEIVFGIYIFDFSAEQNIARMADFVKWGIAAEQALGFEPANSTDENGQRD
jgi:hypothetical protein